jgi:hypothetical protein
LQSEQQTDDERAAARRDSQETWDAFMIVMGVSFFPLIFATIGILLLHFKIIDIPDYNPTAATVKGLGRGLYMVTYFGVAGLIVPLLYSVHVLRRTLRERRRSNTQPHA